VSHPEYSQVNRVNPESADSASAFSHDLAVIAGQSSGVHAGGGSSDAPTLISRDNGSMEEPSALSRVALGAVLGLVSVAELGER